MTGTVVGSISYSTFALFARTFLIWTRIFEYRSGLCKYCCVKVSIYRINAI